MTHPNHNPVTVYMNNLIEILNKNPNLKLSSLDPRYFLLKKTFISNFMIKMLLDYNFYHKNKYNLWGDIEEYNNSLAIKDMPSDYILNDNFQKIYKEITQEINTFNVGNGENLLENLLSQYYFSIYTQKFLFSQGLIMFIDHEEPTKLHNLVYTFNIYYPNSNYLPYLKMITIIAYYESLSPLLFQNNFDIVFNILSMVAQIEEDEDYIKEEYWELIQVIADKTKFIQYQKEMYKSLVLINNGQIGIGINLFRDNLRKYYYLLYKPMKRFSPREYININQPSKKIQSFSMFTQENDHRLVFHTMGYNNFNDKFFYQYNVSSTSINLVNIIIMNMMEKSIEKSQEYITYQNYKKQLDKIKY